MTPLETAIVDLQGSVDFYQQGTPLAPAEGSTAWFKLRAETLALAYVKRVAVLGLEGNPAAAESLYRNCLIQFKGALDAA